MLKLLLTSIIDEMRRHPTNARSGLAINLLP